MGHSISHAFHSVTHGISKAVSGIGHAVDDVAHKAADVVTHPNQIVKTITRGISSIGHGIDDLAHGHFKQGIGEVFSGAKGVIDPVHAVGSVHQLIRPITNPINKTLAKGIKQATGHNLLGNHPLNAVGSAIGSYATAGVLGALGSGATIGEAALAGLSSIESLGAGILASASSGLGAVGLEGASSTVGSWAASLGQAAAGNAFAPTLVAQAPNIMGGSTGGTFTPESYATATTAGTGNAGVASQFTPEMLTRTGSAAAGQSSALGGANTNALMSMGAQGMKGAGMVGSSVGAFNPAYLSASGAQQAMNAGGYAGAISASPISGSGVSKAIETGTWNQHLDNTRDKSKEDKPNAAPPAPTGGLGSPTIKMLDSDTMKTPSPLEIGLSTASLGDGSNWKNLLGGFQNIKDNYQGNSVLGNVVNTTPTAPTQLTAF